MQMLIERKVPSHRLDTCSILEGTNARSSHFPSIEIGGWNMKKSLFAAALVGVIATSAFADEVGVRVGPVGAGVTVGESHDRDRDRDRDRTVIKEREPTDRTTVIKKEDSDGTRSKTVIHDNN
jgi:hypothetical protein